jgi:hypothetical protein
MMYWTKERPRQAGYYWFLDGQEPEIIEVCGIDDDWFVRNFGSPYNDRVCDGGLWFGPIEPPDQPSSERV